MLDAIPLKKSPLLLVLVVVLVLVLEFPAQSRTKAKDDHSPWNGLFQRDLDARFIPHFVPHFVAHVVVYASSPCLLDSFLMTGIDKVRDKEKSPREPGSALREINPR